VQLARSLYPDILYLIITANTETELAKNASAKLFTGNPSEVCVLGLSPTTSTTMMTVIGDILVVGTMKAIGFSAEEYAKRHHGGYLGKKSRLLFE
jgi:arabinose-5-phosphate isomerase